MRMNDLQEPVCGLPNTEHDAVHHPAHYTAGDIECIDAIEAAMTFEEFVGFLRGQMIKYIWRAGRKGDALQDVEKALWYGNRLADLMVDREEEEELAAPGKAPTIWRTLGEMADAARQSEAEREEMATFSDRIGEHLSISELEALRAHQAAARDRVPSWAQPISGAPPPTDADLARMRGILDAQNVPLEGRRVYPSYDHPLSTAELQADRDAIAAKETEFGQLAHLEDTDGNVVLMYADYVNWDEAPDWANFLAYDDAHEAFPGALQEGPRAYWFEKRPEWRDGSRYWASAGDGGRIRYAERYSGYGGDPRLFVRLGRRAEGEAG